MASQKLSRFVIHAGNPRQSVAPDRDRDGICGAVQDCFQMNAESMFLEWNWVCVPVSYKYDLSMMLVDVLEMLEVLTAGSVGDLATSFPSDTFSAYWDLEWDETTVSVRADWLAVGGPILPLLRAAPVVEVAKSDFLSEWRRPLEIVLEGLRRGGYTPARLPEMTKLANVVARLPRLGVLYRTDDD